MSATTILDETDPRIRRVEAFSDGVFAIAITLLAIDIKVPDPHQFTTGAALMRALGANWPTYAAFFTSFTTIFIMWVNHHAIFRQIRHLSLEFKFVNGLLLMLVTLVSPATALTADYLTLPAGNVATALYCSLLLAINLCYNGLWYLAAHNRRLLRKGVPERRVRRMARSYFVALPVYAAAIGLALVQPIAAMTICSLLWILWGTLGRELVYED